MGSIRASLFGPKASISQRAILCPLTQSAHSYRISSPALTFSLLNLTLQWHTATPAAIGVAWPTASLQKSLSRFMTRRRLKHTYTWKYVFERVRLSLSLSTFLWLISLCFFLSAWSSPQPDMSWSRSPFQAPALVSKITFFFVRLCLLRLVSMTAAFNPITEHWWWLKGGSVCGCYITIHLGDNVS